MAKGGELMRKGDQLCNVNARKTIAIFVILTFVFER